MPYGSGPRPSPLCKELFVEPTVPSGLDFETILLDTNAAELERHSCSLLVVAKDFFNRQSEPADVLERYPQSVMSGPTVAPYREGRQR